MVSDVNCLLTRTETTAKARKEFLGGVKAMLPILLGAIPFGVTYGVLAFAGGLGILAAFGMSSIVFAGSSQFVAVQLSTCAPAAVIILTTFMVNLRHALYSASLSPHLKHLRSFWKWLLSYLLTDEAYAVTITHYDQVGTSPNAHWFFFGAGLTLWIRGKRARRWEFSLEKLSQRIFP